MTTSPFCPGEIVLADLNPTVGHEQKGIRPCVIISVPTKEVGTGHTLGLVVVVPLSTKNRSWWTVVPLRRFKTGLHKDSFALCH